MIQCPRPGKIKYYDREAAERNRAKQAACEGIPKKKIGIYACVCGFWHIGHKNKKLNDAEFRRIKRRGK